MRLYAAHDPSSLPGNNSSSISNIVLTIIFRADRLTLTYLSVNDSQENNIWRQHKIVKQDSQALHKAKLAMPVQYFVNSGKLVQAVSTIKHTKIHVTLTY